MQMSAAMSSAFSTMARASRSVFSQQRARRGLGERAAGADRHQVVLGLDHVAVAGDDERVAGVGDDQQRLEPAQAAVGAPVLGELDRGAGQVAELLQLALEALEQRERIGRAAGEAGDHLALVQAAHLAGIALHDRVAERDLAVAADGDAAVAAHAEDRGAVGIEGSDMRGPLAPRPGAWERCRRCGPGAGNQGACRPGSWRCWHGRAFPARRADRLTIRADAWRTSGGTGADARARAGPAAGPVGDAPLHDARARAAGRCARRTPRSRPPRERGAFLQPAAVSAVSAWRPTGTIRVLRPLPSTRTVRSRRSTSTEIEADELGEPQAGRIEQLHHRAVAHAEAVVGADLEQARDLVGVERGRQPLRAFGACTSTAGS